MSDSTDPELARLLDAYGRAEYDFALRPATGQPPAETPAHARKEAARAALLDHLAARYLPRDRVIAAERETLARLAPVDGPTGDIEAAPSCRQAARRLVLRAMEILEQAYHLLPSRDDEATAAVRDDLARVQGHLAIRALRRLRQLDGKEASVAPIR